MGLRPDPGAPDRSTTWADRNQTSTDRHVTVVDPRTPWNSMIVWFLAAFDLGPDIAIGFTSTDARCPPDAVSISTPDGSWAHVSVDTDSGGHEVVQGGPRRLWRMVEAAHQLWEGLNRPGWDRFGLTVTCGEQVVWIDHPDSQHRWPVTSPRQTDRTR